MGDSDQINAGIGDDRVFGNSGDDRLSGGAGSDLIAGGAGNDLISGNGGADQILGGPEDDIIVADYIMNTNNGTQDVPDGVVDTITCGDGNDTVFLSMAEGDIVENDCEVINPSSSKLANIAQLFLGNATENSQSNRTDIDQNCELAVAQSNGILDLNLCQKIKLSSNETPDFAPVLANNTGIVQSSRVENLSQICGALISKGSDDVATDICNSSISASSNQTQ